MDKTAKINRNDMRFLFLDPKIINIITKNEKPSGGAAVQSFGWARGLIETGHDVFIMTDLIKGGELKEEVKDIKLIPLYDENKGIRWIRWVYYRFPDLYTKIKKAKPDYLYQSVPGWSSFLIGIICKQLGVKYILRISNDYFLDDRFKQIHSPIHGFFMKWGMEMTDIILCQNDYQLDALKKKYPRIKTKKISNPILYQSNRVQVIKADQRKYIAWLGIFQSQKNLKLLYEIASRLTDTQICIAGKATPKIDKTTQLYLKKLRTLPNVTFMGFLDRNGVLPFLKGAKFLLNTSHYEGFSNTFLEAMTVGTPILSTPNVNPDGIIDKNQLGLIYTHANQLSKQLESLDADDYQQLSENVVDYVSKNHNYKVLARNLVGILQSN
ncbi:glycosyltransferase family 4 protein [Echinicola salinicaeni]|uniref:glycosyltransferase family 4 protein n=1 Tax=Echinicola salinicaeni TaxID=2762757 RepID=UPI001E5FDA4C|nr:glycosyltransferase [Echinicola salinicaeni]